MKTREIGGPVLMESERRWRVSAVLVMLIAVFPAVLWPGDNLWTNDEPRLIASAFYASQAWHPAWGIVGKLRHPVRPGRKSDPTKPPIPVGYSMGVFQTVVQLVGL